MKAMDMEIIKSRQNEYIKMVKKLSQGKYRKETGLCYVEGEKCVQEALMYSDVETILYTEKADVEKLSGYAWSIFRMQRHHSLCPALPG